MNKIKVVYESNSKTLLGYFDSIHVCKVLKCIKLVNDKRINEFYYYESSTLYIDDVLINLNNKEK